ncbi:hypothetical protein [Oscillatoria sp. FACHB-1406]|uniref:beta strand repeat-containing protein n=1 Tax=Oscillatoria sp. FACHB-1406 TaxID=2692846 RepID=UPI0016840CE6|nr:hypothetical protein [Oscillatoria sp. FACHB-1406]MBD2580524.1 hypothetical protein [Oscillatoria sp. FACHB-1406]
MKHLTRSLLYITAVSTLLCPVAAIAQTEAAPRLTPRLGGQFTTGSGAGYGSSFGSIYGWIPFLQTPGRNVAFAETRLNVETQNGRLGGNFLLGYRGTLESDWVWGTYLGYDLRSNGRNTFHQVGAGADLQGAGWEVRFNAYVPVGKTEATVAESETVLSSTATDGRFVGNYLQFTRSQTTRRDRIADSALTGADLEVGGKLAAWEGGDLRGYVGGYLYSGENISTFAGFRSRIVARPTANTNIGLTVQRDREFGTNLILSIGASWGGSSPNPPSTPSYLSESIERQSNIALARRTTSSTSSTSSTTNALNPATGQPWFFRHVSANSNGNGTIETPYSSIEAALNGIPTDGNQIVYVQGSSSFGGNLTVADNVQLLSTGPIQQIPTPSGSLQLPLSGSGNIPTLTSAVRLGSGSLIDGFNLNRNLAIDNLNGTAIARNLNINITAPNESGISCSNISGTATLNLSNVNLAVNNASSSGIRCTNVSGTVAINSANITVNNTQAAILLQNSPGSINLSGLTVTANHSALLQGSTFGNLSITNTTLIGDNAPTNGITLENVSGTATITANSGSRVNSSVNNGIALTNSSGTINFSGLEIANNKQAQVFIQNNPGTANISNATITANNAALIQGSTLGNLNITNTTLIGDNAPASGITLDSVSGTATIAANSGSHVNSSVNNGIALTNSSGTINFSGLEIANNKQAQVFIQNNPGTANLSNATITANNAALIQGSTLGSLNITNTTLIGDNAPASGITLDNVSGTATIAANSGSRVNGSVNNGIALTNSSGTINLSGLEIANNKQAQVFIQNNPGTANLSNATITANNAALVIAQSLGNLSIANSILTGNNAPENGITLDKVIGTVTITANSGSRIFGSGTNGIALTNSTGTVNISGLEIANTTQNAVRVQEVSGNLNLENLNINNSGQRAFFLENTTGNLNLTIANSRMTNSTVDGVRVDLNNNANLTAAITGNTIDGVTDLAGDGLDFEAIGASRMNLNLSNNTIRNSGNSAIELEVQNNGVLNGSINNNIIANSGGDGVLFLHNSAVESLLSLTNNTISDSGLNGNGITKTPGPPPLNVGNGGFGIGVITVSNGNLKLTVDSNTIANSKDAKIGIAANPDNFLPAFSGTSRIDARVRGNTLSGTGGGATTGAPFNAGSFGALADSNSTICLQLQNNTADDVNGSAYLLANLNPGTAQFQRDSHSGNTGTLTLVPNNPAFFPAGTCN